MARISSVPPEKKRAARSEASAAAASLSKSKVLTRTAIPASLGQRLVTANCLKARLVDLLTHHRDHLDLAAGRRGETAFPVPEGTVAVSDGQQAHVRHVVEERDRRVEQAVSERHLQVGQCEHLLAQLRTVIELKAAHAADQVVRQMALDRARLHRRVPAVVAVEVAQNGPYAVVGRLDDRALHHAGHDPQPPNWRLSASKPPWNTPVPILAMSSASRSGAQSNSALHSRKVRWPSVTGVSLRVAT